MPKFLGPITFKYITIHYDVMNKTIAVTEKTKQKMKDNLIHPRETFDDLINRLLDERINQ